MSSPQEFIRKQRDGEPLSDEEIVLFAQGISSGEISESQISAFCMAVFLRGMGGGEIVTFTQALRDSGERLKWDLSGPVLNKHSTGGVADLAALVYAPILAACGAFVPMISGRGLGHTGGTLDKLEAIPGYNTQADVKLFRNTVENAGCAIIGATQNLAPAEGKIYSIRDITSTIESPSLIVASIISKKLAAGLDGVVLDVKTGIGSFMPSYGEARKLATKLNDVARACGLPSIALLTDMSQPLGSSAGTALEVQQAIKFLKGENENKRLHTILLQLAEQSLILGDLATDSRAARKMVSEALDSGKAAEHFAKMVSLLGGPNDILEEPDKHLEKAKVIKPLPSKSSGYIHSIATRHLGLVINYLGAGRAKTTDSIDHSVGVSEIKSIGDSITEGEPLLTIHANSEEKWEFAAEKIYTLFDIATSSVAAADPVLETIEPSKKR